MQVSRVLIEVNEICNYIPIISTVSNIVNLFLKCIADCLPEKYLDNAYWSYINDLSLWHCAKAAVPVLGNITIFLEDRSAYQKEKAFLAVKTSKSTQTLLEDPTNKFQLERTLGFGFKLEDLQKAMPEEIKKTIFESKLPTEEQRKLINACILDNPITLKALLQKKSSLDFVVNGQTLLCLACQYSSLEIVKLLIAHGTSVNAPSIGGFTPLMMSITMGKQDIVNFLLKQGADPAKKALEGVDAAYTAILNKDQADLLPALFGEKEDIDHRRYQFAPINFTRGPYDLFPKVEKLPVIKDLTPLSFAALVGATKSALYLIDRSDVHHINSNGATVLHYAAAADISLVKAILAKCKDSSFIDQKTSEGLTALGMAILKGKTDIAVELLRCGADPFLFFGNETLFDIACQLRFDNVLDYIKDNYSLTEDQLQKIPPARTTALQSLQVISQCQIQAFSLEALKKSLKNVKEDLQRIMDAPRKGMEILFGRIE